MKSKLLKRKLKPLKPASQSSTSFTLSHYLSQAISALSNLEAQLAIQILKKALETFPQTPSLLELLGIAEMDSIQPEYTEQEIQQCQERAKLCFLQAIEFEDSVEGVDAEERRGKGYDRYLYLGQLSEGKDAIGFFEKGVEVLKAEIDLIEQNNPNSSDETAVLKRKISTALCSMCEIYMTDCCDEPEAESSCDQYLKHAFQIDSSNPEVHQTYASFKLSQSDPDEARKSLLYSKGLWYVKNEGEENPNLVDPPEYQSRMSMGKMLIEVGEYEHALDVLETCIYEDDQDSEGWYVSGWGSYQMGTAHEDKKPGAWKQALECFETVVQDGQMVAHSQQLVQEITGFLADADAMQE
ncbi:hypothetical protein HK098_006715 [Nowakowskiella sp. JEL0407]|nr:hypothetical protein HK098_006715 [Nowakowskiella sp. JEL0407]